MSGIKMKRGAPREGHAPVFVLGRGRGHQHAGILEVLRGHLFLHFLNMAPLESPIMLKPSPLLTALCTRTHLPQLSNPIRSLFLPPFYRQETEAQGISNMSKGTMLISFLSGIQTLDLLIPEPTLLTLSCLD